MLINNISKSISEMSDAELYDHIKNLRKARRVHTPIPKGRNAKPKTPNTAKLTSLAESLPDNVLKNLIAELEADL